MVVPVLPEAQPHRFVGTVRRETVESSGTGELLFRHTDRFGGRLPPARSIFQDEKRLSADEYGKETW